VSVEGQFDARNRMPLSVCRSLSGLRSDFDVTVSVLRQDFL